MNLNEEEFWPEDDPDEGDPPENGGVREPRRPKPNAPGGKVLVKT